MAAHASTRGSRKTARRRLIRAIDRVSVGTSELSIDKGHDRFVVEEQQYDSRVIQTPPDRYRGAEQRSLQVTVGECVHGDDSDQDERKLGTRQPELRPIIVQPQRR